MVEIVRILYVEHFLYEAKENPDLLRQELSQNRGISDQQIEITEAMWLDDAVEKLNNCHEPPDVIILGLMLARSKEDFEAGSPRINMNAGFELWLRLRKRFKGKFIDTPIIVVTSRGNPEFRLAMETDPTLVWKTKPLTANQLANEVVRVLSPTRR